MNKPSILKLMVSAVALVLVLAACGPSGLSDTDAEEIRSQLQDINVRLDAIETTVEQHAAETANGEELVTEVQEELSMARDVLAQVDDRLAPPPPPADDFGTEPMPGGF